MTIDPAPPTNPSFSPRDVTKLSYFRHKADAPLVYNHHMNMVHPQLATLAKSPLWNQSRISDPGFVLGERGYSDMDCFRLLAAFSDKAGIGYTNMQDIYHETADGDARLERLHNQLFGHRIAIVDGVDCNTENHARVIAFITQTSMLGQLAQHVPDAMPERIVMPMGIVSKNGARHYIVGALEWDRTAKQFRVSLFEQHAQRDGDIRDFSEQLRNVGELLKRTLSGPEHAIKVDVACCEIPYCKEPKVCPTVGTETVRRLALSNESPRQHLKDPRALAMDADDVAQAFARDKSLILRERTAPSGRAKQSARDRF